MSFTPSSGIDYSKERDWPASLGMLDWDSSNIVFTKRSLIEFLKYTGVTVDTNFSNIQKLPKYAVLGKFSPPLPKPGEVVSPDPTTVAAKSDDSFVPSRRVRQTPGGPHTDIFGGDFQDQSDALSLAPPKDEDASATQAQPPAKAEEPEEEQGIQFSSSVRPSRRVRENPGGKDSLSNLWTDGAKEEFRPTRRVREGPGGQDSISNIF